ncbi:MAG TPA: tetratricopeptide repeat protein [Stellaceae bacterium]|nr:tetratricopeptide repeat protein [Stellaceae bacterium]
MTGRAERRLTTILAADIAGYSRLMRADEDSTLSALTACRAIVDALIREHRGRIANTAGDAVLAEFPSVVEGLSCALAMQPGIARHNETLAPERRMQFRIGLHIGDVLIKDGDLFGDAVNIAARLEGLAEPGGICVSAAVREHVGTRVSAVFSDAGAQRVKNIADPVRVFRVTAPQSPLPLGTIADLPLPDKPSVAVLPFTNMSSDPEQEYLADGIAEDIITALSRYPSLFVIARNSSFTYKGRAVEVKQVGRELGVRYVLEGSLRKSGKRIRVTAQLIDAGAGNHVWAERYDRDLADLFAVQDEITDSVTIAVAPAIAEAELQRAMRKPPESLDAWGAYQRGLWHLSKFTREDTGLAEGFFEQAISLDPTFAGGCSGSASARLQAANAFMAHDLAESIAAAERLARRAVALDGADGDARACLARVLLTRGDFEGARAEVERALAISPNLASAHGILGSTLIFSGSPKEGLAALERGIRLDPRDPRSGVSVNQVVLGLYFCREYEAAIEAAKRVISSYPDHPLVYRWLAAALGQTGRTEEAQEALAKAVAVAPGSFDLYVRSKVPWHRQEDHDHMVEGLRKAGWKG